MNDIDGKQENTEGAAEEQCTETVNLHEEIERLREKSEENWNLFLRARADLENYRKRSERDLGRLVRQGKSQLVSGLLGIVDNLERAMSQENAQEGPILDGVRLIHRQMLDLLAAEGVTPIDAEGKLFDPAFHECVSVCESLDAEDEIVLEEIQRGYMYQGEVIRAARVRVARPG